MHVSGPYTHKGPLLCYACPQVKWALMVAGCLRRVGRLEEALYRYRAIYATHPTNMECLRYLVQLSQARGPTNTKAAAQLLVRCDMMQAFYCRVNASQVRAVGLKQAQ
jgi:hypothetical protein